MTTFRILLPVYVLLFLPGDVLSSERKRYDGYKVLQVIPADSVELNLMRNVLLNDIEVDFWSEPSYVGRATDFMVSPLHYDFIIKQLTEEGIAYQITHQNVQDQLDPMWMAIDERNDISPFVFNIDDFNTIEDIYIWMDDLQAQCPPDLICEVYSTGNSYEGYPIKVFKISKTGTGRQAFWLDATIHAREWISTATTIKIMNHLVFGGDADAVRLVDTYDWYFMPVVNPDGYNYTWNGDRLWRKNRTPNPGSVCFGTDLNRNFAAFNWGKEGISLQPCSDTYCGASAGSEPEIQAISQELLRAGPSLLGLVSIHSYGQLWIFSFGNTVNYTGEVCQRTPDYDELMRVANIASDAIEATYGTVWERGNGCEVIYAATGNTIDFAYDNVKIRYPYTPELRGNSFIIPSSEIEPSFVEVFNGIVAMVTAIEAP